MPLYRVLDPNGILIMSPAAQQQVPQGAVVYLSAPPSAPISVIVPPGIANIPSGMPYQGYGPPARPGDPGYVAFSLEGQFTASALASGRIQLVPPGTAVTPAPPAIPAGTVPPQVPAPAPPNPAYNRLLYLPVSGQPGLHVAVSN